MGRGKCDPPVYRNSKGAVAATERGGAVFAFGRYPAWGAGWGAVREGSMKRKEIVRAGWAKCLLLLGMVWVLVGMWALPARAQNTVDNYSYPGYNASASGYIDLMHYMKQITMTVNGQEYTPQELQALKDAGTPLTLGIGDSASFNFRFALCGRAYQADDPTELDENASTHVTYSNGTTYLNGETVAPGTTGILDDSSLMVDNRTAEGSYLRMDISWLLKYCPDGFTIDYTEGGVSFEQRDQYLYVYFPAGIGQDTYADPGYFSIGVTLGETLDEIRIPGTDGYYVPGSDDWVFPVVAVNSLEEMVGTISTYGDIHVKKVWQTGGQSHPDAKIVLHYKENGQDEVSDRILHGDTAQATFTIRSGMTDCWVEEDMTGLDGYTSTLSVSEDGTTYTFTNTSSKTVTISKRSLSGTEELPGAQMELYCLSTDGTATLIDSWTSGSDPHTVALNPGRFNLHEELAPAGYAVSQDIPFTVREDLTVQLDGDTGTLEGDTLIVTDKPLTVKFAKVDSAGNPLAGAVLTLTDKTDGKEIDRWTTTTEPHEISLQTEGGTVLVAGHTYLLHEESAPEGYLLAEDVEFVFNGDGTIPNHGYATVTMEDRSETPPTATPPAETPTPKTPGDTTPPERVQTGDSPWMWVWLALGIVCLCAGAVTGLFYYRRSHIPAYWRLGMRDE